VNYHPDDFINLVEEVEAQGGAHLASETHRPRHFRINQPLDPDNPTGPKHSVKLPTSGCKRRANFLVALLPEAYFTEDSLTSPDFDFDDSKHPRAMMDDGETPALAKVCAVDDAMGLWPRFQDAMQSGQSFEVPA
jgi:hypothetical protein